MYKRTISVLTGSRAEFGILLPLLKRIKDSRLLTLDVIATGMHLLPAYGDSIREVVRYFPNAVRVPMYAKRIQHSNEKSYYYSALALGIQTIGAYLQSKHPDILVVLGDRLEPFAATLAAATESIPIVHIHGGDKTNNGQIDEEIRFSISRFAHLHFVACNDHKDRLIKIGEEPTRIYTVGALGLDSIRRLRFTPKREILQKYDLKQTEPYAVCLFHPVIPEIKTIGKQMKEILASLTAVRIPTILIYPNNDKGSREIIEAIRTVRKNKQFIVKKNIDHSEFHNLLHYASFFIGNSSSGIIESPFLHIPFIHVGTRNTGRIHAQNTVFTLPDQTKIGQALRKVLTNRRFLEMVKHVKSPYGNGHAAEKIVRVLESVRITESFLRKQMTY